MRRGLGRVATPSLLVGLLALMALTQTHVPSVNANPAVIRVPQDYLTIQAAIDAATPGDTVIVSSATYFENLTITKSLNLTGVSRDTTIIDASGSRPGINITAASGVWISGFTVRNTGFFYSGIIVSGSRDVIIIRNKIQASVEVNGVYIIDSNTVAVRDNVLTGNLYGVRIQSGYSNIVQKNNITGNTIGVHISNSTGNQVEDNQLRMGEAGLTLASGSTGAVVSRNLIANNTVSGILLRDSGGHRIFENKIEFNRKPPPGVPAEGVHVQNSTGNTVYHNNIRNNDVQVFAVFPPADIISNTWNVTVNGVTQGNFWGDYVASGGADDGSNGRVAGDGIGDTLIPYPCPNGGQPCSASGPRGVDFVPLMSPWQPPGLNVTASAQPLSGYSPLQVVFTSNASGGSPAYSFSWDFGDGGTSASQNATHTYSTRGNYVATVTVTDSLQVSRSDSAAITVLARLGSLVIKVLDESQKPVAGATVTSLAQPVGQVKLQQRTNDLGLSAFSRLEPGTYTVEASSAGYESARKDVTVVFNQTKNEQLTLAKSPQPLDLTFVLVGAGIAAAALATVGVFLYRRKKKERAAGKNASSASRRQ